MTDRPRGRGRPPVFEASDNRRVIEIRAMLADRRHARTPYEAARYLAECSGIVAERDKRAFAERLRRKLNRLNQIETTERGPK
jgi:hypothetical protein